MKVTHNNETEETTESVWYPGKRKFVSEPLFVARDNATAEDDGWIAALVHDGGEVGVLRLKMRA